MRLLLEIEVVLTIYFVPTMSGRRYRDDFSVQWIGLVEPDDCILPIVPVTCTILDLLRPACIPARSQVSLRRAVHAEEAYLGMYQLYIIAKYFLYFPERTYTWPLLSRHLSLSLPSASGSNPLLRRDISATRYEVVKEQCYILDACFAIYSDIR